MDLFTTSEHPNLLPLEGEVYYYGKIIPHTEADRILESLLQDIDWQHDEAFIYGKHYITKRKVAWYGDTDFPYSYSGATKHALPWTDDLLFLKKLVEKKTGELFNSCLLNLYHSGEEGMAWHSDDEKTLAKDSTIASLSFGAERKFMLKHKASKQTLSLLLEHGSLLAMKGSTQRYWLHSLPKSLKVKTPRVNLTFRQMETPSTKIRT